MGTFIDNSAQFLNALDIQAERALTAIGIHLTTEAQDELENAPRRVDTGLLRNSITYALDGESAAISSYQDDTGTQTGSYSGNTDKESGHNRAVYIGTNVEYSEYVHDGTVNMSPNKFLRNAVEHNQDQIKQYLEENLKK
jgi:HK97 gp10 family phage protein